VFEKRGCLKSRGGDLIARATRRATGMVLIVPAVSQDRPFHRLSAGGGARWHVCEVSGRAFSLIICTVRSCGTVCSTLRASSCASICLRVGPQQELICIWKPALYAPRTRNIIRDISPACLLACLPAYLPHVGAMHGGVKLARFQGLGSRVSGQEQPDKLTIPRHDCAESAGSHASGLPTEGHIADWLKTNFQMRPRQGRHAYLILGQVSAKSN
jgi:hypothetical protein